MGTTMQKFTISAAFTFLTPAFNSAISRVNCVDEEMLFWLRKAGCIQISYGVESGSERIRDFLNKNIATADIKKAFHLTRSYGKFPLHGSSKSAAIKECHAALGAVAFDLNLSNS